MAVFGLICLVAGSFGAFQFIRMKHLTPHQLAVKLAEKAGFSSPGVKKLLAPSHRYDDHEFIGTIRKNHPRGLLTAQQVRVMRQRYLSETPYRERVDKTAKRNGLFWKAVGWVCAEDQAAGKALIDRLVNFTVEEPFGEGKYGNGLELALVYDLTEDHPAWSAEKRQRVNLKLEKYLLDVLLMLDEDSASMWHGRFQLACTAWAVAAVMDPQWSDADLRSRAQAHFLQAIRALEFTGGWPEGYNYWINNRAFSLAASTLAHINAVDAPVLNERLRSALETTGMWTIHGTEPIGRFVLFGDTGPRNDLKDETQRVIDLIGLATGNTVFLHYSKYLYGLHGSQGYYGGYQWGVPLFRGLPALDFDSGQGVEDLSLFDGHLPTSALFGENTFGQVFMRSDWGPDATFIAFRAGHSFTHHGHYCAGHFSLTKKAPLAIKSGTYGGYTSPHRLNYFIRTVAANSLLILRPGEKVKPNRFFAPNVADGGQRIVMPTGSAVLDVDDWKENVDRGRHYEGGWINVFDNSDPNFVYVGSDLTGAYNNNAYDDNGNGGKVSKVTRQLAYIRDEDILAIHDRVATTHANFTKKWLLHCWNKPQSERETVLVGDANNGILETNDANLDIENGDGMLRIARLLPADGVVRKIGGPDYRYYVETDGDDTELDGMNMTEGANEKPWYDAGLWRIEIEPKGGRKFDNFLHLLKPGIKRLPREFVYRPIMADGAVGVETKSTVVLFAQNSKIPLPLKYQVATGGRHKHIIVDMPPGRKCAVLAGVESMTVTVNDKGVLIFHWNHENGLKLAIH